MNTKWVGNRTEKNGGLMKAAYVSLMKKKKSEQPLFRWSSDVVGLTAWTEETSDWEAVQKFWEIREY